MTSAVWKRLTIVAVALATVLFLAPAAASPRGDKDGPQQKTNQGKAKDKEPWTAPPPPDCGDPILKDDGQAWECTFSDDFTGIAVDPAKWHIQTTAASRFSTGDRDVKACYMNDLQNVSQSDGTLKLTVRQLDDKFRCGGKYWRLWNFHTDLTAGSVSTYDRFSQAYGRFEIRAKIPSARVPGLQSSLWMWPDDAAKYGYWPRSGEIDIAEMYSQYPDLAIPRLHYSYDASTVDPETNTNIVTAYDCAIDNTVFNTYVLEWAPGRLEISINGETCLINNYQANNVASPAPFDHPFMLALTSAVGEGTNRFQRGTTPSVATTEVDYVRVWQ